MYLIYILLLIFAFSFVKLTKVKKKNTYLNQSYNKKLLIVRNFLKYIIISIVSIDLIYFLCIILLGKNLSLIELFISLLFNISLIISYYFVNLKFSNLDVNRDYNELDNVEEKKLIKILFYLLFLLILGKRVEDIGNINISILFCILTVALILSEFFSFISFLNKSKNIVCIHVKTEDLISNIKFANKIEIDKIGNYLIFALIYILIIYADLPFAYIIHILISILLIAIVIKKKRKIEKESSSLYKSVTIAKRTPGVIYAFEFERDIEFTKNLIIIIFLYIFSVITFYSFGNTCFIIYMVQSLIFITYLLFVSKKKLIRTIKALDESYIDKNIYTIKKKVPITCVEQVKMFGEETFYKLVYIDNNKNVYKSNIILYDPDLFISDITMYINAKDMEDYVIVTKDLYQ